MWVVMLALGCDAPYERDLPDPIDTSWVEVWADEFDGSQGTAPDAGRWTYDLGGGGWGNEELQVYTDSPDNVRLDGDGHLEIVAREETVDDHDYTSARMNTRGLFELTYGRFEASIRLPEGQGLWPAFWMLGGDFAQVGWPQTGEVDIMEYRGQEPDTVFGTVHGPGYSGGAGIGGAFELDDGTFADGFHTFAVEVDPEHISWYVDDDLYHRLHPGALPGAAPWVFDHPQFIILNLAVGGTFVGDPDANTEFPATVEVDYVRVFQRAHRL